MSTMRANSFNKTFDSDEISKRERVDLTLNHKSVDRVALLERVDYNPSIMAFFTGKKINGFKYTLDDICCVIKKTLDVCFPPNVPRGTKRIIDEDGITIQNENWTRWIVKRPFSDVEGARLWLEEKIRREYKKKKHFSFFHEKRKYNHYMNGIQKKIGETTICSFSSNGFCDLFFQMGLEIFSFFSIKYPELLFEFMHISTENELDRIRAIADRTLTQMILIPEDFATKHGLIFSPEFLRHYHFPFIEKLTRQWHDHDIKVIYHSDGNYKKAIPDLIKCGVDGFYCLEPNCLMDIVELKKAWPDMIWAGSIDGVDLMERGKSNEVILEVNRQIRETKALEEGGIFLATSSTLNPLIKLENFNAMIFAVGELHNSNFA
jgi:hypothetical protein